MTTALLCLFSPGTVVVERGHTVVAVLAMLRARRPDDVARDAVVQLISHVLRDGVWQSRRCTTGDDTCTHAQNTHTHTPRVM